MILLLYFLALVACKGLGAPATLNQTLAQNFTDTNLSSQPTQYNVPLCTVSCASSSVVLPTPSNPTTGNTTSSFVGLLASGPPSTIQVASPSPLISPSSVSATSLPTSIVFITDLATAFETTTVDAQPSSTTVVTVIVTETVKASTAIPTSPSFWENRTVWAAPSQMSDLSAFNVTSFPSGENNLHLVSVIPAGAFASTARSIQGSLLSTNTTDLSTLLQLVYPAHSVNPGSRPTGGADFYASPLNLAGAHNVTLSYSVFFPVDFDWVKGGKLPGLFGGHTGCSGGSSATDCFSTRLMWRPQGVGELYLYAPKDKQTSALCNDGQSVCDTAYGFSIGRGAFNFTAGDWTHVAQTVVLNTPGKNDGVFALWVNGRLAIYRTDMLYRDVQQSEKKRSSSQPAEFLGLFFSTFFGGHGKKYATPREQYTWFKDFEIVRHD
ncbi:hypothetical protein JVU11DRAFT_94 [Chiua virens]|nr:hypothetical protein JVU11DRAFT_94 [Chiua virens]